jgi:hypothetical protein
MSSSLTFAQIVALCNGDDPALAVEETAAEERQRRYFTAVCNGEDPVLALMGNDNRSFMTYSESRDDDIASSSESDSETSDSDESESECKDSNDNDLQLNDIELSDSDELTQAQIEALCNGEDLNCAVEETAEELGKRLYLATFRNGEDPAMSEKVSGQRSSTK